MWQQRLFLWATLLSLAWSNKPDRKVIIRNESGSRVEMNWLNPTTGQGSLMTDPDILHGAEFNMDSYVSHTFELKELPARRTNQCKVPGQCQRAEFTVNNNEKQVISIDRNFQLVHEDHKSKARDHASSLLDDCKLLAIQRLNAKMEPSAVLEDVAECMSDMVTQEFTGIADEISFQAQVRKKMGEHYENYTCADPSLPSSPAELNTTWYDKRTRSTHPVKVMLDRPASKIHVVENFISDAQCNAMEAAANGRLMKAVVADGSGGHDLSDHRRALQAGIRVKWEKENEGDPIATISRKVYDYVNHVTGFNIDEKGQEDLMSIQYFGRGLDDTEPDQYKPHCDGECTGDPHKNGTRVATIVMYCTVAEVGGATNFRNAGVHVNGKRGSAVFFSYMDSDTHIMDSGFTEHSGCPVLVGEKKIVTQWVRHGVTEEIPWNRYNSLGILQPKLDKLPEDGKWLGKIMDKMRAAGYDVDGTGKQTEAMGGAAAAASP